MILVYDSGLGGISALPSLVKKYPHQDFLFFGDREHAPYGNKDPEILQKLFVDNLQKLKQEPIQDIIVQCNTMCSLLDFHSSSYHIHDIIDKTLQKCEVLPHEASILVVGTALTVQKRRYQNGLAKMGFQNVQAVALKELAGLIERFANIEEIRIYLRQELASYHPDYIILACTHYPFYASLFTEITGAICLDSNDLSFDFLSPEIAEGRLRLFLKQDAQLNNFLDHYLPLPYSWYQQ